MPQFLLAINIHNIQVTQPTAQSINVSLTTEAVELYYFDSWNYSIQSNTITVNAYFIEGFGSTIAYLNNNFLIPLSVPQTYVLVLRVFYTNNLHTFKTLEDSERLTFRYPMRMSLQKSDR